MCRNKTFFCNLNESYRQAVKLGNKSKIEVIGKGDVRLKVNGFNHMVIDVYFVPDLKNNLLSIGQVQEKGLDYSLSA